MLENLLRQAESARNAGNNKDAALIYEQAIKICDADESHVDRLAFCLQELAAIYWQYGLYEQVIPLYQKLVSLGEKVLGETHPDVLNTIIDLANAFEANKQFAQADEVFKMAVIRAEKELGLAHPLAQEIRQEYFNVLANRENLEDEIAELELSPLPATKEEFNTSSGNIPIVKIDSPLPMKKSSNLKQPRKIRKLRYGAEAAANHPLTVDYFRRRWRGFFYVGSVIVGITAIAISLSQLFVPTHVSNSNLVAEQLIEKGIFQSIDGLAGISFIDNKYALLTGDVYHHKIPYFLLKGNLSDTWAVLLSVFIPKENWYQYKPDELTAEGGSILYTTGAPEFVIADKMRLFADFARRYYTAHGCYPDKGDKLTGEPGIAYINPFNSKAELPIIKRLNGTFGRDSIFSGLKPEANASECFSYLEHGGTWHEESTTYPGRINSLALFTSQRCADGYKVNEFYIHSFDRHGKLLTSGKPDTTYVLGLYAGKDLTDQNEERLTQTDKASVHTPQRIYIVPGDSVDLSFLHQFGITLLGTNAILSFIAWIFLGMRKRLVKYDLNIQSIDVVFLVSFIAWAISFIIHLLG